MRSLEGRWGGGLAMLGPVIGLVLALAWALAQGQTGGSAPGNAPEMPLRWRAPIAVERPGAFVQLPLPGSVYARAMQGDLADLRIVDAHGDRVPFALLTPPPTEARTEERHEQATPAKLYPLPPVPGGGTQAAAGIELSIEGGRVSVRAPVNATTGTTTSAPAPIPSNAPAVSPGWLIDLGDPDSRDSGPQPRPHALRLEWSGPAEFSAGFSIESSRDLRDWQSAGSGQVMALASLDGVLTQPLVTLPPASGRYVRLIWRDPSTAPQVSGAQVLRLSAPAQLREQFDAVTEVAVTGEAATSATPGRPAALDFDLGAVLPVQQLNLDLGAGTRVAPARLQVRARGDQPWRPLGGAVFYRIERGSVVERAPALPVAVSFRYLRLQPDERAGALDPQTVRLLVRAPLASLVFTSQGQPPYALLAGSAKASPGALPLTTLVPVPDQERARFGHASLGAWSEVGEAVRQQQAEADNARWRPRLLWGVLIGGVLVLGALVWRLARSAAPAMPAAPTPPTARPDDHA